MPQKPIPGGAGVAPVASAAVLPTTMAALDAEAARRGVSRGALMRDILTEWIEQAQQTA